MPQGALWGPSFRESLLSHADSRLAGWQRDHDPLLQLCLFGQCCGTGGGADLATAKPLGGLELPESPIPNPAFPGLRV